MLKPREEGVPVTPYPKISGFRDKNLLSSGFVFNLSLILPPPFHQQNLKKVVLIGRVGLAVCTISVFVGSPLLNLSLGLKELLVIVLLHFLSAFNLLHTRFLAEEVWIFRAATCSGLSLAGLFTRKTLYPLRKSSCHVRHD